VFTLRFDMRAPEWGAPPAAPYAAVPEMCAWAEGHGGVAAVFCLDILSGGRASFILALGYRPEEFEHFGVALMDRGRLADEKLGLLRPLLASRVRAGQILHLAPLCGGLPPEVAWPYLKRVGDVVLPEALSERKTGS
jgi:luciferase-like monooxygenase